MPNNTALDSKASAAKVNLKEKKNPIGAWKLPTKSKHLIRNIIDKLAKNLHLHSI
jgi:hypothetical protein